MSVCASLRRLVYLTDIAPWPPSFEAAPPDRAGQLIRGCRARPSARPSTRPPARSTARRPSAGPHLAGPLVGNQQRLDVYQYIL